MMSALSHQQKIDDAFDNYIELSDVLRSDLFALLETESNAQHWRRNYIRASASLIEGHAHCFREMCKAGVSYSDIKISQKENELINSEFKFDAKERI